MEREKRLAMLAALDKFLIAATPVVALDPVVYDLAAKEAELRRLANLSTLSTAEFLFWPALAGAAEAINRQFGSRITVDTPAPVPSAFPTLTPEQVAAIPGATGVTTTASGVQEIQYETPPAPAPVTVDPFTADTTPVVADAPAPPDPVLPPTGDFGAAGVAAKIAPPQTSTLPMALNTTDPSFGATFTTSIPGVPTVQPNLGGDLVRILGGAGQAALGGGNLVDILQGGLQGYLGPGTTPTVSTPALGPAPTAGGMQGLEQQVIDLLKKLPPTYVLGQFGQAVYDLVYGSPSPGGLPTLPSTGNGSNLPADPRLQPPVTTPVATTTMRAPRGYVVVTWNGQKVAMLKTLARHYGLWSPRKKPPISASDWGKLKTAKRVERKAKTIAKTAGFHCYDNARPPRKR